MSNEWFYEYEGEKHGPVPPQTLKHLARHGAIVAETRIWKVGVASPVQASRIKNLLPVAEVSTKASIPSVQHETVGSYLQQVLEAIRDEDDRRWETAAPPLHVYSSFSTQWILLEYEVQSIKQLPSPIINEDTPPTKRTKPVRQLFEATVRVVVCERPNYRGSLAEIRHLAPGRREQTVTYECKEFQDGMWLFFSESVMSG